MPAGVEHEIGKGGPETAEPMCPLAGPLEISAIETGMLASIGRLRVRAWKARQPTFPDIPEWTDGFDAIARHWVIMAGDRLIAAARMTVHRNISEVPNAEIFKNAFSVGLPGPVASINRLVVDPNFAGKGLSRLLDDARIADARARDCASIIGETFANTSRVGALEALGFEVVGAALDYASGPLAQAGAAGRTPSQSNTRVVMKLDLSSPRR